MLYDTKVSKEFEHALTHNFCAMKYVSTLSDRAKRRVMDKASRLKTADEIHSFVSRLADKAVW